MQAEARRHAKLLRAGPADRGGLRGTGAGGGGAGHTPAPWRDTGRRQGGGVDKKDSLQVDPPAGFTAEEWRAVRAQHEAGKQRQAQAPALAASQLPEHPLAGFTLEEWNSLRERHETALKQQPPAAPQSPTQLLQAAEKADKRLAHLERQVSATQERLTKLQTELQEAKVQAIEARAASLRAQVPSVGLLPCTAENLLEGILAKDAPHLLGAPEASGITESFRELLAKFNTEFGARRDRERAAEKKAEEDADAAARLQQEARQKEQNERPWNLLGSLAEAANVPVEGSMEVDDLDDETLQGLDPSNARPTEDADGSQLEQWRVVQRGTARKVAEQFGQIVAAKRAKSSR